MPIIRCNRKGKPIKLIHFHGDHDDEPRYKFRAFINDPAHSTNMKPIRMSVPKKALITMDEWDTFHTPDGRYPICQRAHITGTNYDIWVEGGINTEQLECEDIFGN